MTPRSARPAASEEGFTLIEMIVSLAILSVGFAAVLAAISQDLTHAHEAETAMNARALARSLLDTSLVASEPQSGETPDGLRWTVRATPLKAVAPTALIPLEVDVVVRWSGGGAPHQIRLSTFRFAQRMPQR
jgi:prepilin-type N-terminal cleavage/methylation domain-containing protein